MSDDFDQRVRDMMRTRATHAPDDYPVVQHVLHEVQARPAAPAGERRSSWRSWLVPLVAAGAVAAVAATVVGVETFRPSAQHHHLPGAGIPGTQLSPPVPSTQPTPTPTGTASTARPASGAEALKGYHILDLSYVGDTAWALARTACAAPAPCASVVARSDNGGAWRLVFGPTLQWTTSGCTNPDCVADHIRFATPDIGYVFGSSSLYLTTDGGRSWTQQPGGALALETLDGNVIRTQTACLPGCPVTVQTAPIGSDTWALRTLPGSQPGMTSGMSLVRVPGWSYLELYGHVAGGAQDATSRLFVSHDDGRTWTNMGEPCPQTGGGMAGREVDSTAIAAGGSALAVVCAPRGTTRAFVRSTSYQPAAAGTWPALAPLDNASTGPLAVSGDTTLLAASDGLYLWAGSDTSWRKVPVSGMGALLWLGFESATDARAVSADGATVWTTHDAGVTWTPTPFP
jgi:hypothetical protein